MNRKRNRKRNRNVLKSAIYRSFLNRCFITLYIGGVVIILQSDARTFLTVSKGDTNRLAIKKL